jgi:hypothetical protein
MTVLDLRNAILERLTAPSFGYVYALARKTPLPTLQADQLPALSVFILDGDSSPDGDGNSGVIRFITDETIAVSVVRALEDPVVLEGNIDVELEAVKSALFTDPSFTRFWGNYLFESITRIRRRWSFPREGDEYRVELRYEMTFRKREQFEPVIADDFAGAVLTVRQAGSDPDAPSLTVKVIETQ